ncbi:hypothetical protein [Tenacibaculum phage Larrie]|nr:hypothetical protein [Tenacibaculum phage Larrie]
MGNKSYIESGKIKKEGLLRKTVNYLDVDVWRSKFGVHSTRAVFNVYSNKFKVSKNTMRNNPRRYSFSHCLNSLRRLENPNYKDPEDTVII